MNTTATWPRAIFAWMKSETQLNRRRQPLGAFRLRVAAAFLADAERSAAERDAEARAPSLPPFLDGPVSTALPRPEPLFFPPPVSLLTVAHARRSASFSATPRRS